MKNLLTLIGAIVVAVILSYLAIQIPMLKVEYMVLEINNDSLRIENARLRNNIEIECLKYDLMEGKYKSEIKRLQNIQNEK